MGSTSSAKCTSRRYMRIAMTCRRSPKSVQISAGGERICPYLHLCPGIFPAQRLHLTNLRGDAVRAWCFMSAGFTTLLWRLTLLEAFGARYAAGLRSRLDL